MRSRPANQRLGKQLAAWRDSSFVSRTGGSLVVVLLASSLIAAEPSASAPAVPPLSNEVIDRLVSALNDPHYDVRDRATLQLAAGGLDVLARLVDRYRAEAVHERKLRLRYVIEHLYYQKLMAGEEGFIGIRLFAMGDIYDPQLARRCECVYVQEVLQGLPAQAAGLRDGDIMVGFDGRPIAWFFAAQATEPDPQPAQEALGGGLWPRVQGPVDIKVERFTQHVKRRTPGAVVQVRVLRCDGQARHIAMALPADPGKALDGATLVAVPGAMLGRSPLTAGPSQGGLLVVQVVAGSLAEQAGIKPRDIVTAVLVPQAIAAQLNVAFETGKEHAKLVVPNEGGIRWVEDILANLRSDNSVTFEIVRLEELEIPVKLGRRPVRLMNAADLVQARARFAAWWREEIGEDLITPTAAGSIPQRTTGNRPSFFPEPQVAP